MTTEDEFSLKSGVTKKILTPHIPLHLVEKATSNGWSYDQHGFSVEAPSYKSRIPKPPGKFW